MVPGKYVEDNFGDMEVGDTGSMQGTYDDVIYNLCEMNNNNYVMRMMATGGCLLADEKRKETVIRRKENGEYAVKKFKQKLPFDWNFVTDMWLMTTTTSGMHCHKSKIYG